jgi:MFS family permease
VRAGPLREPNFRAVFIGQATSALGNGLVPVALAFAVLQLTGSTTDLGLVLTSEFVAQLALFLAGGVVADRISRRAHPPSFPHGDTRRPTRRTGRGELQCASSVCVRR